MQFTPQTDEELKASQTKFKPLPDGDYPFTVLESSERAAGPNAKYPGRTFANLKLAVHGPDGRDQWVWDSFADYFSQWKLKHFCEGTGQGDLYNSGGVDFANNRQQGTQGYVRIFVELDDKGRERNAVNDYIVPAKFAPEKAKAGFAAAKAAVEATEGDDVPF